MIHDLPLLARLTASPELAMLSAAVWREIFAGAAVVVTLVGVRLCWTAPRHRMSVEEHAKDGELTEEQARRKIRFIGWFGPAVTIAGCALLAFAILP